MNENKNSHTTSTKCQYQAAHSKPTCLVLERELARANAKPSIIQPTKTWNPWNPVRRKKVLPYTPSTIVKEAEVYSEICTIRKTIPNLNVIAKGILALRPCKRTLWAHVTLTPDLNKITVLRRGTPNPSITQILSCGQVPPISNVGINENV